MRGARGAPLGSGGLRPGAGRLAVEQDGAGLSPLVSASLLGLSSIALSGFATPRVQEFDSVGTWFLAARMEKPQKDKRQMIKIYACCNRLDTEVECITPAVCGPARSK